MLCNTLFKEEQGRFPGQRWSVQRTIVPGGWQYCVDNSVRELRFVKRAGAADAYAWDKNAFLLHPGGNLAGSQVPAPTDHGGVAEFGAFPTQLKVTAHAGDKLYAVVESPNSVHREFLAFWDGTARWEIPARDFRVLPVRVTLGGDWDLAGTGTALDAQECYLGRLVAVYKAGEQVTVLGESPALTAHRRMLDGFIIQGKPLGHFPLAGVQSASVKTVAGDHGELDDLLSQDGYPKKPLINIVVTGQVEGCKRPPPTQLV